MYVFVITFGWVCYCTQQTHPKVMTNMLKKVFNWSEVHLSEMTCYKIHTLKVKKFHKSFHKLITSKEVLINNNHS